ncbi:EpsG family protein [Proteus terrae]|uniref:EpsG family protein n=1 Tax=Proteus terrae TaxID=1574161 RepID=UPI0021B34BFC|nr:EpsG family protein [Proteus terrae]UXA34443.1 EpsG family protein [Proteus terrae]
MVISILIYNLILLFSAFFIYLSEKIKSKYSAFLISSISFLFIYIPAAIRYNIGTDYWAFAELFEDIKNGERTYMEYGYYLLNKVIAILGLSVEWYFAIISFITYILLYKALPRHNKVIFFIPLYTISYLMSYTSLRSAIVLMISLIIIFSYINEPEKKLKRFLWLLIGFSIHTSIIFLLILPILNNRLLNFFIRKYTLFIIFILILFFIFRIPIINIILGLSIWDYLPYGNYIKSPLFTQIKEMNSGVGMLIKITPLLLVIFFVKDIIKNNKRNIIYIYLCLLTIISIILASTIDIFSRLDRFFSFTYPLSLWLIWNIYRFKERKLFVIFAILGYLLLFEINIIKSPSWECDGQRIWPYVTIFNKEDDQSLGIPRTQCSIIME